MGYELEIPHRECIAFATDVGRLERAVVDADRRLTDAIARSRALHGAFRSDELVCLASQIRVAQARQSWREAVDALAEWTMESD